jgi:ectoine hydroxylase-related dioxygenase (phytanoyl-CoA dioxygenase family)
LNYRPWCVNPSWTTESGWFHHDRGPVGFLGASINRPTYIQGVVNLLPTSPGSGGNVVLPRSHLLYPELVRQFGVAVETQSNRDHGGQVTATKRIVMEEGYEEKLLVQRPELFEGAIMAHLEAGDLFLWDDRTFHCNASGHPSFPTPPDQLARAAVLCCMAPRGT